MCISLIFFKAQSNTHLTRINRKKKLFSLWHSVIPLSSLKRFWSEQQSQTFLINSFIHFEKIHWSCFFQFQSRKKKNHSHHNSPLNRPCLMRTSAAASRWRASQNPGESPGHLTRFLWVFPFLPWKSLKAFPSLVLHGSLKMLLSTL